MKKVIITIPHDNYGNQLTYPQYGGEQNETPDYCFKGVLRYVDFKRGRSALNIVWQDVSTGKKYRSGMGLLHSQLTNTKDQITNTIDCKVMFGDCSSFLISGSFGFKKQGTSVLLTKLISETK